MELNWETVHATPRAAATVMMLRDGRPDLEVLLLRRHSQSDVLGGAHVFPGGKVDASDTGEQVLGVLDQSPDTLHRRLNEPALSPHEAAAIYVAAAREVLEEAGLLLAHGATAEHCERVRTRVLAGHGFAEALADCGLQLSGSSLLPWSRWITPTVPSVMSKRFDTRFFVTALPDRQTARHDDHEATASVWLTPRQALGRYWANQIELAPPQIMSLAHLARYHRVTEVLQDAASRPPALIAPEPFEQDGTRVTCYPGDPRHSRADRAVPGPTRLVYRNRRFEPEQGFEGFFETHP